MPLSNIHWIKNDRIISDNSHLQIQSNVHHQQCLITQLFLQVNLNVDWKDFEYDKSGRYECRAENSLGHHSHHFDYYPKRSYSHLEKDYLITSFENPSYRTLENQTSKSIISFSSNSFDLLYRFLEMSLSNTLHSDLFPPPLTQSLTTTKQTFSVR